MQHLKDPIPKLQYAQLDMAQANSPINLKHNDVYFSRQGGLEETQEVFLRANHLPERFDEREHLVIGELGFGTGLNFLATWKAWLENSSSSRLTFVSVEKNPIESRQLKKILTTFPEIQPLANKLFERLPDLVPGWHPIDFESGRLRLLLGYGEALDLLSQFEGQVDAWFFDGFAPARNPELWSQNLFHEVAQLSHSKSTFGTYSAAHLVKEHLENAGFAFQKVPGFGHKKDRLQGHFTGKNMSHTSKLQEPVTVIGAGLAGCATARALAKRGQEVILIEKKNIAAGASGNPAGLLKSQIASRPTPLSLLSLTAFGFTRRTIKDLIDSNLSVPHSFEGTLQLGHDSATQKRIDEALKYLPWPEDLFGPIDANRASALSGHTLTQGGAWFSKGGWIDSKAFCEALTAHPLITVKTNQEVISLENILATSSSVVLANASEALQLAPWLPLERVRGQILFLPQTKLKIPVSCGSYLIPTTTSLIAGASFDRKEMATQMLEEDSQKILSSLQDIFPKLIQDLPQPIAGRVAFRAFSKDHLPLVGQLPDLQACINFKPRRQFTQKYSSEQIPRLPGVYLLNGLASRGLLWAPILGDLLAAQICQDPLPISKSLTECLDPARFVQRSLNKGEALNELKTVDMN